MLQNLKKIQNRIQGMGTTREELMPHMKRVAAANAQIVIDLCATVAS